MQDNKRINCFQCKHFFITWDPKNPRGCKAYHFKSKQLPSNIVLQSSGHHCLHFSQKSNK